jgi:N-acetylglucosaminyldiphosphoundecaprenol N-acetyl-beta-D-mannosaminyltransferase
MPDFERNIDIPWFPRARIGRALVDCCSLAEAVDVVTRHAALRGPSACVVTPNAQHIVLLESDAGMQQAYAHADLVLADGASLLMASRLLGEKLCSRIAGIDLFERLCHQAAEFGLRVFLLGGHPGSAQLAAEKLQRRFRDLPIVGTYCPPPGFEHDDRELQAIDDALRRTQPDLVFVALGAPKQEFWMHRYGRHSGAPVLIGVGGSFEIMGGLRRRAPRFLQRIGAEWLYRLLLEPRRLWRRYLIGNGRFLWIVLRQRAAQFREKPHPSRHTSLEGACGD